MQHTIAPASQPGSLLRCFDCGSLHASVWLRCPSCESIFQQEQRLFRGAA